MKLEKVMKKSLASSYGKTPNRGCSGASESDYEVSLSPNPHLSYSKYPKLDFSTYWAFILVESMIAAIVTITITATVVAHSIYNYHTNKLLQLQAS